MATSVSLPMAVTQRLHESDDPWRSAVAHDHLRLVALGLKESDIRPRAMSALADTDAPTRVRDLEAILRDQATSMRLRHLAATLLGRIDTDSSRDALLGALAIVDERLAGHVVQSLGRIGDRSAFNPIEKRSARLSGFALTQARFALRLLAHRFNLSLPTWPDEEIVVFPRPAGEGQTFRLSRAHPIEAQIAVRSLAREPFGIELGERTAHQIRCDESQLMVLLERDLERPTDDRGLLLKKRIVGVVGRKGARGLYSTMLLILSAPDADGDRVALSIYQPNGTLALTGSAVRKDKGVGFELRAVARRGGLAIQVHGTLVGDRLSLTTARSGRSRRNVGTPAGVP